MHALGNIQAEFVPLCDKLAPVKAKGVAADNWSEAEAVSFV